MTAPCGCCQARLHGIGGVRAKGLLKLGSQLAFERGDVGAAEIDQQPAGLMVTTRDHEQHLDLIAKHRVTKL